MIAENLLPISFVSTSSFKRFMASVQPQFRIPCRQSIADKQIPLRCAEIRSRIDALLAKAVQWCVTIDIWTNRNMEAFMGVTAHGIVNYEYESLVLACKPMTGAHTAEHIAELYDSILLDYGLTHKVSAVVSDNASNMVKAFRLPGYVVDAEIHDGESSDDVDDSTADFPDDEDCPVSIAEPYKCIQEHLRYVHNYTLIMQYYTNCIFHQC